MCSVRVRGAHAPKGRFFFLHAEENSTLVAARSRKPVRSIALLAAAVLLLGLGACGDSQPSEPTALQGAIQDLAVSTFVTIGTNAAKKECSQGNTAACKLAFIADPAYQDKQIVQQKLDAIGKELTEIKTLLDAVLGKLDALASQLAIGIADVELTISNSATKSYTYQIASAYDNLLRVGADANPETLALYVRSAMLQNAQVSDNWAVIHNLDQLHYSLVDRQVGLFVKLQDLLITRINQAPGADPTAEYELLEEYFGHVLAEQAKGLVVVAACYNWLEQAPANDITPNLLHKTFAAYVTQAYRPHIEEQTQLFLRAVEALVAQAADPDRPGMVTPWVEQLLLRADLAAAWTRASLPDAAGVVNPPAPLLVARVVGEPDRVALLQAKGGLQSAAYGALTADETCLGANFAATPLRSWATRKPYVQFPVHPELTDTDVKNRGAIKGAASVSMLKYARSQAGIVAGADTLQPVDDLVPDTGFEVVAYGPDGKAGAPTDAALLFGHQTLVLRESAGRRGIWNPVGPANVEASSDVKETHSGSIGLPWPQSLHLNLTADPKTWSTKSCDPSGGGCWNTYYVHGNAYLYVEMIGEYYFEGWGDVPSPHQAILSSSGDYSKEIRKGASNGNWTHEIYLWHRAAPNSYDTTLVNLASNQAASVTSANAWTAGMTVKLGLQLRTKVDWNKHREAGPFRDNSYDGSADFMVRKFDLVLK